MATKKEFKQILKEFNLTEEQFQAIYEDVAKTNKLVNNFLNISKIKLQDLAPHLLRQLPTQKEKDLKMLEEKEIAKERERLEKLKKEQDEKYYWEHFEEIMLNKIDNKEELTRGELKILALEYDVDQDEGDEGRWERHMTSIAKLRDRYFAVNWGRGLTEYQENSFYEQPYEVEKITYEKTITVTEWKSIKNEENDNEKDLSPDIEKINYQEKYEKYIDYWSRI